MLSDLGRDVRYAIRSLLRTPTFTVTVIVTLSLGIGANAVIFSAVDAVLLRDAPVSNPDSLVNVFTTSGNNPYSSSSYPDYFDLRDSGTFAALAAYTPVSITLDAKGTPEPLAGQLVTGNYFEALGVNAAVGRGLVPDDDRIGAPVRVAVISHALWQRVFNSDQSAIGQTVRFNSNPYTLIGVAPPGFVGPTRRRGDRRLGPNRPAARSGSAVGGRAARAWSLGDLRPAPFARTEHGRPAAAWHQHRPGGVARGRHLQPPPDRVPGDQPQPALYRGADWRGPRPPCGRPADSAAAFRCRADGAPGRVRECREPAARARRVAREGGRRADGDRAGRARLVRQWLTESVLLGILGALGALFVAGVGTPLLHAFVIPEAVDLSLNARVLGFTLAAGVGSGLLFGLAPVFRRSGRTRPRPCGTVARSRAARG